MLDKYAYLKKLNSHYICIDNELIKRLFLFDNEDFWSDVMLPNCWNARTMQKSKSAESGQTTLRPLCLTSTSKKNQSLLQSTAALSSVLKIVFP